MVRETLEQHADIRISKNTILGEVEFLIDSNSKLTIPEILKSVKKNHFLFSFDTMQLKILPEPKFKYQIKLKQPIASNIDTTTDQTFLRPSLQKAFDCDQILFTNNTIEIWSSKELDLTKLKDEKNLQLHDKSAYGKGIKSVQLLVTEKTE